MKKRLKQNLGKGISITTEGVHTFGTDAILLADYVAKTPTNKLLELGAGCGIISMLLAKNSEFSTIHAVDIQKDAFELCSFNIMDNNLDERVSAFNLDLRELKYNENFLNASYDAVVMNPPYKRADDGVVSPNMSKAIARHEIACNLKDIIECAFSMLNTGGHLYMCHRPERLTDVLTVMRSEGIEPKRICFVHQNTDYSPNLFLVDGIKGSSNGIVIDKPIFIKDEKDNVSPQMKRIMGDYYFENKE